MNLKEISTILIEKGKVRGKPVAITLFRNNIPEEYSPIESEPCTIIRLAMDEGKRVYFDERHHDCLVGAYHCGLIEGKKDIVNGEYLSKTSSFFSYEGAARLKAGMRNLPPGMVKGIGAAPLDDVPENVDVDWIVVVANPHNANNIAACRIVEDGIKPYGSFGTSLCGELFSSPWHEKNVVITFGDFGGRMFNRIKNDELFVIIPIEYVQNLHKLLVDVRIDTRENLAATKPEWSKFWKKKEEPSKDGNKTTSGLKITMPWDDEAISLVMSAPDGIREFAVEKVEEFAKEKKYTNITRNVIAEQMESVGLNIDDMLG